MASKKSGGGISYNATIADYQRTFDTPSGKKVLYHLMKAHGVMERSFIEDNQFATAFNEGGRNVVLQILKKLKIDLRKLEQLQKQQEELMGGDDVIE